MGKISVLLILFFTVVAPIWLVFYYISQRQQRGQTSRATLKKSQLQASKATFNEIEKNLQGLESYVTSSEFTLHRELNRLRES